MTIALKIIFLIFLFLSVWWTLVNISKLFRGDNIPRNNFIIQSMGLTGVIGMALMFKDILF